MAALLEVRDLHVAYGQIEAVRGISFEVDAGEVVALIGSNGAGKTTTLRTLSGLHRAKAGEVHFDGERIDRVPAHEIVARGVAHAPEGRRLFPRMTIRENLDLGAYRRRDDEVEADVAMVYDLFPILAERRSQAAGTLSGGEQQMLAIGRALMSRPRLLMLDEPSMGLSPLVMRTIFSTLRELKARGTTLRTLSGLHRPKGGEVRFDGERVDRLPAHEIVARGVAHAPEGRRLFGRMTVRENLDLGAYRRTDGDVEADVAMVYDLFPILAERRAQAAGTLSGGEQQMLAIGRALMSRPRLLMLDEPSMGLSPLVMRTIFSTLAELKERGTTLLLVEQNAQAALALADHGHVLETGRIVLSGTAADLLDDEGVRKAYLGED